tara:strand:- start:97677 stop:99398 length:1722 start_codon:yes stop_codon:yes gene_type:complete
MSWKKHFTEYSTKLGQQSVIGNAGTPGGSSTNSKYSTWLPEVYAGQPNRIERYYQYDQMDLDTEINASLDTISEFATQVDPKTGAPFKIFYKDKPTDTETEILNQAIKQWSNVNDWDKRCFKLFRNTIKYGDQVFVRDPETYKLLWVDQSKIDKIIVNEGKGKKPEAYFIRDLDLNLQNLNLTTMSQYKMSAPIAFQGGSMPFATDAKYQGVTTAISTATGGRFTQEVKTTPVDASHIAHISLSEGMDRFWPFGTSVLESIFKVYKQKELLEDAIIIYRVQRAPERRVFYIDVGNMPTNKAMAFIERVKNEIHQKRIPNKTGGGANVMDAAYNPLSMIEDYFFAQTAEGRGSKVETLPGGQNLGEIDDLKYFNNKLMKGLRIPSSYLPSTPEDPGSAFTDGRVGTAYIQEFRFTKYIKRLQSMIQPTIDREFKMFLKHRGIEIDSGSFELQFNEPQNFGKYRQIEIDNQQTSIFTQLQGIPFMSKRFAMKRYLGLDESEIYQNEKLWAEENAQTAGPTAQGDDMGGGLGGLSDVGAAPMPMTEPAADADVDAPEATGETPPIGGGEPNPTDQA